MPATDVDSRALELDSVETWAKANNLALSRSKTVDIVFTDGKRKRPATQPPSLPDISRASTSKVLGVTISNKLSVSDHVTNIISKCSQTLTILRAPVLCDVALQSVYSSVVIAKLLYTSSAWWGFTSSFDRQPSYIEELSS